MKYELGDYRIRPIHLNEVERDGVYYNNEGAWIGNVVSEELSAEFTYRWVKPLLVNGYWVAAPENWHDLVIEYLGALDV